MDTPINLCPLTINSTRIVEEIDHLARTIDTYRNNDATFGYYLLEKKPDNYKTITSDLLTILEMNPQNHKIYLIRNQINEYLWYILFKNYADRIIDDPVSDGSYLPQAFAPNVEASYRSLEKWICTRALREAIEDYWYNNKNIKCILWHHAIDNKASGLVFANNGFSWLRYHKQYVYMPNTWKQTDTIMWILWKETFYDDVKKYQEYQQLKQAIKTDHIRIYPHYHNSHKEIHEWYYAIRSQNTVEALSLNNHK